MIVQARAPVRVDFAGGWSDVPMFADQFGGVVVNAAISRYVTVQVEKTLGDIRLSARELDQSAVYQGLADVVYDGTLDLHKAAARMFPVDGGVAIQSSSSVPPGSGLGTSGALDVALVTALSGLRHEDVRDRTRLAELAFQLEAVELGLTGGRQDQYAAAHGGFLRLDFSSTGVVVRRLRMADTFVADLHDAMIIAYTGQTHFSSETHDRVWSGFRNGVSHVTEALHALRELGPRTADALEAGDLRRLADLVDENWFQQQRLHSSIATSATRAVEKAAREAGAWGAKATGAGAGGCMILIGEVGCRQSVTHAVERVGATVLDYQFDLHGVRVISS